VNTTERQSFFASLSELVESEEALIHQHPPETSGLYAVGSAGLLSQLGDVPITSELEPHEFLTVLRYLLCSSFIAAWADLHEPKFDSNKAATACMMALSCMSEEFLSKARDLHLHIQTKWKQSLCEISRITTNVGRRKPWWQFWK
jgi:hypothetical protein